MMSWIAFAIAFFFIRIGSAQYAWWLTVQFTPTQRAIAGVPLDRIEHDWALASLLEDLPLPREEAEAGNSIAEHGGAFSLNHDFDNDGNAERVLVGVYTTKSGEFGRFLIILGSSKGMPRVLARFVLPGTAGFSVLFRQDREITWATCMECDVLSVVEFHDGKFSLSHYSCEDCG